MAQDELLQLRQKIERIDEEIIALLAERLFLVKQIAEYKKKHGIVIFDEAREQHLFNSYESLSKINGVCPKFIRDLFGSILIHSKEIQRNAISQ